MKKIILPLLALTNLAMASEMDKKYLKGELEGQQGVTKLTFGLTDDQMNQINQLTKGKVDFSNLYVAPRDLLLNKSAVVEEIQYASSNHTPPFLMTELDPTQKEGWWQQKLRVQDAWELATGKGVVIADCDAGYYHDEEDLKDNLLMEHAQDFSDPANPTVINDGGYVSHGTAVSAIMVGALNGKGINGISYNAKVVPLQNYNYAKNDRVDKEEATAKCIIAAIKIPDVRIIVLENQTHGSSETFSGTRQAVRLALKAGITIVSAAGNSTNELKEEAADDTDSIIVGAVDPKAKTSSFSNYGSRVSIAAYGSGLLTLGGPNGAMTQFGGTSGATPQVASTVAMMLEVNPELSPKQVKEILIATRTTTEENKKVGGLINIPEAIEMAKTVEGNNAPTPIDELFNRPSKAQRFRNKIISILNQIPRPKV